MLPEPPPGDPALPPWVAPFSRRRDLLVAIAGAVLLAALIHPFPDRFVFRNGGDCVRYLTWSHAVANRWILAFPALVDEYRHRWVGFPPPTRWAWLMLIAVAMRAWPHAPDEYHPLVLLSWLGAVLSVAAVGYWLRRRAPAAVVVVAMVLLATSPLSRAMGHFPLPDALHTLFCILLFAFTAEWLAEPRPAMLWALGVTTLLVLATRETGIINVLGAAVLVAVEAGRRGRLRPQPLWALLGGCVAMVLITVPLAGGPLQTVRLAYDVVHAALYTSGAMMYATGPYYRYLVDFMIVSPVVVVTALVALAPLRRGPERDLVDQVLWPTVTVLGLFSLLTKTLRYVLVVDAGLRILAAMAVVAIYRQAPRRGRWLAAALLVALVAHDLAIYRPLWGKDQIYDPVTWGLTKYLKMIPSFCSPGPPVE
jgi:4-amino-4-deoxy-L-arabinose transferase-like glycosyltransferase